MNTGYVNKKKIIAYKLAIVIQEKDPVVTKIIWKHNFLSNDKEN